MCKEASPKMAGKTHNSAEVVVVGVAKGPLAKRSHLDFFAFLAIGTVFIVSLVLSRYAVEGDQLRYNDVYQRIAETDFFEGYRLYVLILGGAEPVHYTIVWLASKLGLTKDFVMAVANVLLAFYSVRLFKRWGSSEYIAAFIVSTNFYYYAFYFNAERLKFSALFVVLSLLFGDRPRWFKVFAILALFSHIQSLVVYISIALLWVRDHAAGLLRPIVNGRLNIRGLIKISAVLIVLALPVVILFDVVSAKYTNYAADTAEKGFGDIINIFILAFLSCFYSKDKSGPFVLFIPLVLAVAMVGSERINFLGYFVFLYYGLRYRGGWNVGVLLTAMYFAAKCYGFIENIVHFGDGFTTA